MNFCLSDLVPPLRWSDAAGIPALRGRPDLPDGWWRSLPMAKVLAVLPPEALGELLTDLALTQWPAAAVGDVLPALHVLDPEAADGPHTAMALDRAGSWPGLLALTSRELLDQPFMQARPLLTALFAAVFARFAAKSTDNPKLPSRPRKDRKRDAAATENRRQPLPERKRPELPKRVPQSVIPPVRGRDHDPLGPRRPDGGPAPTRQRPGGPRPSPMTGPPPGPPMAPPGMAGPPSAPAGLFGPRPGEQTPAGPPRVPGVPPIPPIPGMPETPAPPAGHGPKSGERSLFEPFMPQEPQEEAQAPPSPEPSAEPEPEPEAAGAAETDLFKLIDTAFAALDDKSWAVAQNRLFTTSPGAVEELAKLFAVPPADIEEVEADLRVRLKKWLVSDEARPYRTYLGELQQALGKAVPKAWLVGAADWHTREMRSLEVPAWQFVLASLPGYRLTDGWIVDGDLADLRDRTRRVISAAERPPTVGQAVEMMAELGIHPDVAKEWLKSVPQLRIQIPAETGPDKRQPDEPDAQDGAPDTAPERPGGDAAADTGPHPIEPPAKSPIESAVTPPVDSPPDKNIHGTNGSIVYTRPARAESRPVDIRPESQRTAREKTADAEATRLDKLPAMSGPGTRPDSVPPPEDGRRQAAAEGDAPAADAAKDKQPKTAGDEAPGTGQEGEGASGDGRPKGFKPFKDVSLTRRCFRQPDGRWWLRVDIGESHLQGAECALPSGFAAYLGLTPGESRTVKSTAGELTMSWQSRPVVESLRPLLRDVNAKEGGHLFLTLSEDGVLRARHLPAADPKTEPITRALLLVGYTAPGGTLDQASRVIATRIGMPGSAEQSELLARLRERGDRDLLSLLG